MIPYIDHLLLGWATWSETRGDGGSGYSSRSGPHSTPGRGSGGVLGFDEQALEIDAIVCKMKAERRQLWEVVDYHYMTNNTGEHVASKLKCHRDTIYARLHSAHQFVLDAMHDNTINKTS